MNRPHKYRGRRKDNGEWLFGSLVNVRGELYIVGLDDFLYAEECCPHRLGMYIYQRQVDPDTVGEFTGLYARNNREIYEDDIVHFVDPRHYDRPKVFKSVVQWFLEGGSWLCSEIGGDKSWGLSKHRQSEIEVIGNIYSKENE